MYTVIIMYIMYKIGVLCLQYLQDVNCPFSVQERQETVDWLLGLAVRFEYGDNGMIFLRFKPVLDQYKIFL